MTQILRQRLRVDKVLVLIRSMVVIESFDLALPSYLSKLFNLSFSKNSLKFLISSSDLSFSR